MDKQRTVLKGLILDSGGLGFVLTLCNKKCSNICYTKK